MNSRIQELYRLAIGKEWAYDFDESYAEKFAELIVRECAAYIFVLDAEPVSHKSAARMLMGHFGVEE